jgi:hypothetical protein
MVAFSQLKRREDIAYGWKGKGSTVHLLTEGNGLPRAYLVTAAKVSEVTVGLKVVDRVRVPRHRGVPRSVPPAWEPTEAMTVLTLGMNCDDGGFSLPYLVENGPIVGASQHVPRRPMRSASFAGRWSGVTAGWTTGPAGHAV